MLRGKLTSIGFDFRSEDEEPGPLPAEEFECVLAGHAVEGVEAVVRAPDRSGRPGRRGCRRIRCSSDPFRAVHRSPRNQRRGGNLLVPCGNWEPKGRVELPDGRA